MEKLLLLVVLVAGCALCGSSLARDGVRSGSGIGGGNHGSHFGLGGFLSPKPQKEPSAAAGGTGEKRHPEPAKDKDDKKPEVKKIHSTK